MHTPYMKDTNKTHTSAQGKLLLLRHCACAAPLNWLQLTCPAASDAAACLHDELIKDATAGSRAIEVDGT